MAVAVTLAYAVIEVIAGLGFHSLALVSDAGHMFSDAVALGLAWFAAWLGSRPPGARHSYGLARAEVIAAFVNGIALLLVVVVIAVEAIERLMQPPSVNGLGVMVVAFVGLLLNVAVVVILSRGEHNLNLRAALLHVVSDLVGSVAALASGAVIYFTGWAPIDPILSLLIGLLILASTVQLLREALHVLMEGVPGSLRLEEVGKLLARIPGVRNVHDLHIWTISSGRAALSAHMDVVDLMAWPQILEDARRILSERYQIDHVTLQPESGTAVNPGKPVVIQRSERG
jgi:cobalt-zinc-cadmium efflux system protein